MDSNTHSAPPPTGRPADPPDGPADRLGSLVAAAEELAAADLDRLPDTCLAEDVVRLRRLVDGLEGQWLRWVAAVDAQGRPAPTKVRTWGRPRPGCATACG